MSTASAEPATTILLDLVARPQRGATDGGWARTATTAVGPHDEALWLTAWALLLARLSGSDAVAVARLDGRGGDAPLIFTVDDAARAGALVGCVAADPHLAPDSGWAT